MRAFSLLCLAMLGLMSPPTPALADVRRLPDGTCENNFASGETFVQRQSMIGSGGGSQSLDWDDENVLISWSDQDTEQSSFAWYTVDAQTLEVADFFVLVDFQGERSIHTSMTDLSIDVGPASRVPGSYGYRGQLGATSGGRNFWVVSFYDGSRSGIGSPLVPTGPRISWRVGFTQGTNCEPLDLPRELWHVDETSFSGTQIKTPVAGFSDEIRYSFSRQEDLILGVMTHHVYGDVEYPGVPYLNSSLHFATPTAASEVRSSPAGFATTAGTSTFRAMYRGVLPRLDMTFTAVDLPANPETYFLWWQGWPV